MTETNRFIIIKPEKDSCIEARLASVYQQLGNEVEKRKKDKETLVYAKVFLSDIINQLPLIEKSCMNEILGKCATSFIEQPPVDGSKITIMACFSKDAKIEILPNNAKRIITPQSNYIFQSIRFKKEDIDGLDGKSQTILAFEKHKALLAEHNMTIADNTIRTWLYVRDIDRTYMGVVKGRNEFFAKNGLTVKTHFIASTGICGYSDCPQAVVAVDFLSQENLLPENVKYLHALEYLNPTAEYGVAFERGTAVNSEDKTVSFISGTASIDKFGNCIYLNEPRQQVERVIENINALLSDSGSTLDDIQSLIVYLRDTSDYKTIEEVLREKLGNKPMVITEARVCRPQWLVETECIACKKK